MEQLSLHEKIAGEITLSEQPGLTIKKWREIFGVSQQALARKLQVSPSVLSDYEGGRRKSPGVANIRKIVIALIEMDREGGSEVLEQYGEGSKDEVIFGMREFPFGKRIEVMVEAVEGEVIVEADRKMDEKLYGYTVIDSLKAITKYNSMEFSKLFGWSTQRALFFTGIKYGRSPLVAIKSQTLKPSVIFFHKPTQIDELGKKLAQIEGIVLASTDMPLNLLLQTLEKL
jgi:putative transcriptional regulator